MSILYEGGEGGGTVSRVLMWDGLGSRWSCGMRWDGKEVVGKYSAVWEE